MIEIDVCINKWTPYTVFVYANIYVYTHLKIMTIIYSEAKYILPRWMKMF